MITKYSHNGQPYTAMKTRFVLWSKEGTDPQWGLTRAHPSMETIYSTKPRFGLLRQQYGWVGTYLTSPTLELEIGNFFGVFNSTQNDPVQCQVKLWKLLSEENSLKADQFPPKRRRYHLISEGAQSIVISDSKRTSVLSRRVITIYFSDSVRHSRFSHPASICHNTQGVSFLDPNF